MRINKELAVQIGDNIKRRRRQLRLSQDELAHEADVDRSYVGRIERGQVALTVEKLYQLATVLRCQPTLLMPHLTFNVPTGGDHG